MNLNELIQQIMTKKNQTNTKLTLTFKTLAKPKFMNHTHSFITLDENDLFYTFNGRALFLSKEQAEPIISIPEETKAIVHLHYDKQLYCFLLNSKNKLEVMEYGDVVSGPRFTVTRNVLQVQKTQNKVYFLFKKDVFYFIDECVFDGKRWIGKIMCHNITGKEVLLFATGNTFYFTSDSKVHNCEGKSLGFTADYVHRYENILLIGIQKENSYEFKLLDIDDNYQEIHSTIVDCDSASRIVSHENIVALQASKDLHILKIDTQLKKFVISWKYTYHQDIYNFNFFFNPAKENLIFYLLADSKYSDVTKVISENNQNSESNQSFELRDASISSNDEEDELDCLTNNEDISVSLSTERDTSDSICKEDGFFYENSSTKKSSILKEMESMSLAPHTPERSVVATPKNNLLEEVRATLNKKKALSKPEILSDTTKKENNSVVDRFESYKAESEKPSSPIPSPSKPKLSNKLNMATGSNEVCHSVLKTKAQPIEKEINNDTPHLVSESFENINNTAPINFVPTRPKSTGDLKISKNNETELYNGPIISSLSQEALENYLYEFKKLTLDSHKKTVLAVESMISKRESNDTNIKEIAIKLLVPVVEACFNEMRIQMLSEIKKLTTAALEISEKKTSSISKLLAAGKTTQAIEEFLKLDDTEMAIYVSSFNSVALETVDSNSIFLLLSKIYELVKKSPKDSYFKLIYFCLMEIEINDLSIDQLQDISILIRYIKEMNSFDEDKYSELSCILDITAKKIRKRVKYCNGK